MVTGNSVRVPRRKVKVHVNETVTRLCKGVDTLARLAAIGYGGTGYNYLIQRHKDTVVSNSTLMALLEVDKIPCKDPVEAMGFQIGRDVALRMVREVGCGAGTAILMLGALARYTGVREWDAVCGDLLAMAKELPCGEPSWERIRSVPKKVPRKAVPLP
jgi:hypothetical protein